MIANRVSRPGRWRPDLWRIAACLAVLLAGPLQPVGPAAAATLDAVLASVQARYEQTQDLQADFSHLTSFAGFTATLAARGRFAMKRPGRFRWDYAEPHQQQIVVNGTTVFYYVPEHRQAIRTRLDRETDTQVPIRLLAGTTRLDRDFDVRPLAGSPYRLRLIPRDQSAMQFQVEVDAETFYITQVILEAPNGNTSTFRFTRLRPNRGLGDALFSFAIPDGVEVIEPPPQP